MEDIEQLRARLVTAMEAVQDAQAECRALRDERAVMYMRLQNVVGQRNALAAAAMKLANYAESMARDGDDAAPYLLRTYTDKEVSDAIYAARALATCDERAQGVAA
jgi:predicted metal-dependent hydrolase